MISMTDLKIACDLVFGSEEILLQIISIKEMKINRTECLIGGAVLLLWRGIA